MKYKVTILDEVFRVDTESYHKAKSEGAKLYNAKLVKRKENTYPISYLTSFARAEKVVKEPLGRKRLFTGDMLKGKHGPGSN